MRDIENQVDCEGWEKQVAADRTLVKVVNGEDGARGGLKHAMEDEFEDKRVRSTYLAVAGNANVAGEWHSCFGHVDGTPAAFDDGVVVRQRGGRRRRAVDTAKRVSVDEGDFDDEWEGRTKEEQLFEIECLAVVGSCARGKAPIKVAGIAELRGTGSRCTDVFLCSSLPKLQQCFGGRGVPPGGHQCTADEQNVAASSPTVGMTLTCVSRSWEWEWRAATSWKRCERGIACARKAGCE